MNCLRKLLAAAALAGLASTASAVDGLVIFGDSLSDTGNVAALVGANALQVITDNSYIPSQPYASLQFSNGDVWAKNFAAAIGLASSAQPSLLGVGSNYAFGGARMTADGVGLPLSLKTQQGIYLGNNVASASTLYVIEGGGNDARDALELAAVEAAAANPAGVAAVITFAAATYAQNVGAMVDQLQAAGGQKIVVWNVPNLGLTPAVNEQGAGASLLGTQVAAAMNAALAARLAIESDVLLFDVFGLQNSFVANAGALGLNVTDACGAAAACDPSAYLFWDGIHPTSAGHALLAQAMLEQTALITAVPEPETYALMLAGLGLVGLARRRQQQRAAAR